MRDYGKCAYDTDAFCRLSLLPFEKRIILHARLQTKGWIFRLCAAFRSDYPLSFWHSCVSISLTGIFFLFYYICCSFRKACSRIVEPNGSVLFCVSISLAGSAWLLLLISRSPAITHSTSMESFTKTGQSGCSVLLRVSI